MSLIWTVEVVQAGATKTKRRTWGLEPGDDRRVWLMGKTGIGVGKELEDVEAVMELIHA